MCPSSPDYALQQSSHEYRRLSVQGRLFIPMTRRLFEEAGIRTGMRVLDVGSGAGDVCLLLSEMVGPTGSVVGIERDTGALDFAQHRVAATGSSNITFVQGDFATYDAPLGDPFDAVVGRLVLLYQPDPAAALAAATRYLKPGGSVAFMEPFFNPPQGPDNPVLRIAQCVIETLRRSGAHIDMGARLHRVFSAAGLPIPTMRLEAVMDGSEDSVFYQYIADTFVSMLPKALEYGLVKEGEIDPDQIPAMFRAAMQHVGYAPMLLPTVTAWCRTEAAPPTS